MDEIAAEHYTSQGVIHFGHTCLTPTAKLPALWIFTKKLLDVKSLKQQLQEKYSGDSRRVILVYDVEYDHIMNNITVDNVNLAVGLCQNSEKGLRKFGRSFPGLPSEEDLKNAVIVYVGGKDSVLMNIVYNCPDNEFMVFENNSLVSAQVPGSKLMMKRYFLVEKAKDATRVGLLVGTLGTQQYTEIIERMKKVGKVAKKKMYVFLVGKPNVAKLANFPEVDVFVLVACPESSIVDSKDFLQPIITPFEFELACGNTEWTGNLLTDFKDVIAKNFECNAECVESDVSLISGKIRVSSLEDESSSGGELSVINDKTIRSVRIIKRAFLTPLFAVCCMKEVVDHSWLGGVGVDWSRSLVRPRLERLWREEWEWRRVMRERVSNPDINFIHDCQ